MPDPLGRLVEHFTTAYGLDPIAVAEALQLWQTPGFRTAEGRTEASSGAGGPATEQRREGGGAATEEDPAGNRGTTLIYGRTGGPGGTRPASVVFPYRVREPLDTLGLSRALRPLRRRWPRGRRAVLDVGATVRAFAASRTLVPHFRPGPERWFDLEIVVDDSVTMATWSHTVVELIALLAGLGVFRTVRTWRLGAGGQLFDADRHPAPANALNAPDGRRLIMVVSDCAAAWWRDPAPWLTVRTWARNTPTLLINPLPTTVWRRTALDLPAVRLRATQPGGHGRDLVARSGEPGRTPLPIPALTPHALGRWARTLMDTDPYGCDGALIPPEGRAPEPAPEDDPDEWRRPTPVDALRVGASGRAVRLAVLCALQDHDDLDLSYLHLIRQELVQDADADDLAAIFTGGLFDTVVTEESVLLRFRPGVRQQLRSLQTPTDAWDRYRAVSRHMAATDDPGARFVVVVRDATGAQTLPSAATPIGEADRPDLLRLGLPDTAAERLAHGQPQHDPAFPAAPMFYLSAAVTLTRADEDLTRFFGDLGANVQELVSLAPGQDPGFWPRSFAGGARWQPERLRALGTCQLLVFLLSPRALASQWCAREWDAVARRPVVRRDTGEPAAVSPVLPVLWVPFQGPLPDAVAKVQRFEPADIPARHIEQYRSEGLYGLLRTGYRDAYEAVVWRLSQRIQRFQYEYRVEPSVPHVEELRTGFDRPEP